MNFLTKITNSALYNSVLDKKYSKTQALLSLTENNRKYLDAGNFGTVEHHILLTKLEYYTVRGLENDWFQSYLSERKQFASINDHYSNLASVLCGVPQDSVLIPLIFDTYE